MKIPYALLTAFLSTALASVSRPAMAQGPAPAPQADQVSAPKGDPAPKPKVDPPRLAIDPKGRRDIGSVGPREKKALVYTFTNTSMMPIAIRIADLAPGMRVEGPALERPFPPGESLTLTVHVDPTGFVGWQTRSVRIITDDPKQGEYRLPIGMTVRPDLTVDQARRSFGDIGPHESPHVVFTFTRETGDPTQITLSSTLPVHLEKEVETVGNRTELRLTLRPRKLQPGVLLGLDCLEIRTNAPLQPRFELYMDWKLRLPVMPEPSRIVFLDPKVETAVLKLKSSGNRPLRVSSAVVEGGGFAVDPAPVREGTELELTIRRKAENESKALLVLSFEGVEEVLKVPLAYLPPSKPKPKPNPNP